MLLCYISSFYDMNRDKWTHFKRSFNDYLLDFKPFINIFTSPTNQYEMVLFLDKKHIDPVTKLLKPHTRIKLIEIDEEFMNHELPMWKTLPRERQIMNSLNFKSIIPHRLRFPEHTIPEYSLINHCKIDFINYVIKEEISNAEYFCWVDFGYFKKPENIPGNFLDINKLNKDKINYTLINRLDSRDRNIQYTLLNAPEKIGGFFFFGNRENMKKYQKLYHEVLDYFQNTLNIADDDQHLALVCYFRKPELFALHYTGQWHQALKYFQL